MSSILWQNDDRSVFVIDIPASIADAQGRRDDKLKLLSCEPLLTPWPSNEPKSEVSRAKLRSQQGDHDIYTVRTAQLALAEVHNKYTGPFCRSRKVIENHVRAGQKRARTSSNVEFAGNNLERHQQTRKTSNPNGEGALLNLDADKTVATHTDLDHHFAENASEKTTRLSVADTGMSYHVPPGSSFYLGDCAAAVPFHRALQRQGCAFNFVLADPPWPSASVRRGRQVGARHYNVTRDLTDMRKLLWNMDLGSLLRPDGYMAVWITNKPAVRELVLGEDGWFASCGVRLEEEWLWLKVTSNGEPVLPIDGQWRKPYEVLLVGRKVPESARTPTVKRRVIIAVPDLHSRKPNLKYLLSATIGLDCGHSGLEIFARNLVSGWCSWGNEVLKFNNTSHWSSYQDDTDTSNSHM